MTGGPGATESEVAEALYALLTAVVRRTPRDLSLTALSTLGTLARSGPRRITDLAAVEGVTQPAMTSMVTKLAAAGHVVRRRHASDGRVALVEITDAGADYVAGRQREGAAELAVLVSKLSPAAAAALARAVPGLRELVELDTEERDPADERR
ncbi:MarR family winged helix-turn-helix transcriptional regulator [Nocardioides cheoyonin]|uniref:MarR family winged helix-turn-helix transcriptional regulator n=1 Tax=Nocardioides cheoyonin TaxID=3156615 RepID=UPI0032B54A2E